MTPFSRQKNDYGDKTAVHASDLNLRANLFDAQVYGALWGIGYGVVESPTGTSLKVIKSGGASIVSPGSAIIHLLGGEGIEPHPVYGTLKLPALAEVSAETPYVHARLVVGDTSAAPSSEQGTAELEVIVSDSEDEAGAILLAQWVNDSTLIDRRTFIKADEAMRLLTQIIDDVGYDATARAKGTVAARLDALLSPGDDEATNEVSRAEFRALWNRVAELESRVALLEGDANDQDFPTFEDQIMDHIAVLSASVAEVNPSSVNRGQISVVVANAGHGQFDTPDYTPTTGHPNEMKFNTDDGTFGA